MAATAKLIDIFGSMVDSNGDPLSGYIVRSYTADGSTENAVWEDRNKTLPSTAGKAQFTLDLTGSREVYGDAVYIFKKWTPSADPDVDNPYDTVGPTQWIEGESLSTDSLFLEDGASYLLLESGDQLLLE